MNIIIFLGGFLVGMIISLVVVEYQTRRDIASLIKALREQSEFIDSFSQSAKDVCDMNGELIKTCEQILNLLP